MLIPLGRVYRSKATGSILKDVACERCRGRFRYRMIRTAEGRDDAPLFIGNEEAREGAEVKAEERLDAMMESHFDAVACPHCGAYQTYMLPLLRNRRVPPWLVIVGFFVGWFLSQYLPTSHWFLAAMGGGIAGAGAILGLRALYDPNRNASSRIGRKVRGEPETFTTSLGVQRSKAPEEKLETKDELAW